MRTSTSSTTSGSSRCRVRRHRSSVRLIRASSWSWEQYGSNSRRFAQKSSCYRRVKAARTGSSCCELKCSRQAMSVPPYSHSLWPCWMPRPFLMPGRRSVGEIVRLRDGSRCSAPRTVASFRTGLGMRFPEWQHRYSHRKVCRHWACHLRRSSYHETARHQSKTHWWCARQPLQPKRGSAAWTAAGAMSAAGTIAASKCFAIPRNAANYCCEL